MDYSGIVRNELSMRGLNFIEENGAFQLTMTSGQHCWRCLISTSGDRIVCCSQFPWNVGKSALTELDRLNSELSVGCFLTSGRRVIFRCGAVVQDPLTAGETAISLLRLNGDTVCRCWERVKCCGGTDEL